MSEHDALSSEEGAMRSQATAVDVDFDPAHAVSSLYRAANAVRTHVTNSCLREHDVSWTGFIVLWVVWNADGVETKDAAEAAGISKATLTGVLRTLQSRGWITRHTRDDDHRRVEVRLTDSGKSLMAELYPRFHAIESQAVSGLSGKQCEDMTNSLREIVTAIGAAPGRD
jgi:YD repeat-containing protein